MKTLSSAGCAPDVSKKSSSTLVCFDSTLSLLHPAAWQTELWLKSLIHSRSELDNSLQCIVGAPHLHDLCSRAEVKGALLACQEANILHCYVPPYIRGHRDSGCSTSVAVAPGHYPQESEVISGGSFLALVQLPINIIYDNFS